MKKGRVNKGRNVKLMSADLLEFLQKPFEVPVGDAIDRVAERSVTGGFVLYQGAGDKPFQV
jgi:hypothetical protein